MSTQQSIVLGGGCFWCSEAVFVRVRGITGVQSGYANGSTTIAPDYAAVCTGRTGYAEVVRLCFEPTVITVREILEIFFATHDPTSLNRQGEDVGTQYRSGIYYSDPAHGVVAQALLREMEQQKMFDAPIVTEVQPLLSWWPAEDYHQNYYAKHPGEGFCAAVIGPKVEKFSNTFARFLKPDS